MPAMSWKLGGGSTERIFTKVYLAEITLNLLFFACEQITRLLPLELIGKIFFDVSISLGGTGMTHLFLTVHFSSETWETVALIHVHLPL